MCMKVWARTVRYGTCECVCGFGLDGGIISHSESLLERLTHADRWDLASVLVRVGQGNSVIALGIDTVLNPVSTERTLHNAETVAVPKQHFWTPSPAVKWFFLNHSRKAVKLYLQ